MKTSTRMAVMTVFVMGLANLGHSADSQAPSGPSGASAPSGPSATSNIDQGPTSVSGTVQSVQKSGDGSTQIEVQDNMGTSNSYSVPKSAEVRDPSDKKLSLSKVKVGSSVTLSVQGGQVTKIILNS